MHRTGGLFRAPFLLLLLAIEEAVTTTSSPYFSVNASVRLQSGVSSGPVQWSNDGVNWYTFCSHNWGEADAQVACTQMGYKDGDRGVYAVSESTWAAAPGCAGWEIGVEACPSYSTVTTSSCSTGLPGGVTCSTPYEDYSYNVKNEHLFLDNRWHQICATDMSETDMKYAANNICLRNGYSKHTEAKSVRVSTGFTAYVRSVKCTEPKEFSSCKFLTAPSGKGLTCSDKLTFACEEVEDSEDNLSWLWIVLRFAIPAVVIGVGIAVVSVLYRLQEYRKNKKKKLAQQAATNTQYNGAPGAASVPGGTPAGYPVGYPVQRPPPGSTHQGPPPPAYSSLFQQGHTPTGGPVSGTKTNQVSPTAGQYGDVPPPAIYSS